MSRLTLALVSAIAIAAASTAARAQAGPAPTAIELSAIEVASALEPEALDAFFIRRQRAMHAWDVTVFEDYAGAATNTALRDYVRATRAPLRRHSDIVDALASRKGLTGGQRP